MYRTIIVLQDTYKKCMGIESKCAIRNAQNKKIKREAHLPIQSGPTTNMAVLLAQQQTTMRKAVVGRLPQGAPAATPTPTASSFHVAPPGELPMAVACGHAWKYPPN